ncbi:hypothetical protein [Actinoplanes sp. NPDC051411]|uniref:hypothetical protein n=1 Tax=Actinoplanes sp. NPDC051411 TaxID=3155522 RepID=UPI003425A7F3
MRGGLDDALEKLARRDELRRRAANEATGGSAGVTELVEAIAGVVGRHPRLGVTVGVEGDGDPMVLRFFYEDGQVQVTAENNLAAQPRADFDVEVGEPVEEFPPAYPGAGAPRMSHDDQDRFGPHYGYEQPTPAYQQPAHYAESDTAERRYGGFEQPAAAYGPPEATESTDLGSRLRDLGMASSRDPQHEFPPHPLAPTPPPAVPAQTTRRIDPEQYRAPVEPAANERAGVTERLIPPAPAEPRGMPTPLPQPIPLQVERPEETEMAARRLAALLRDDPTLLSQRPE